MKPPFDIAADLDTPVSAYLKLKPFRPRFLLESVEGGERLARYSFIGFGDCLEVRLDERGPDRRRSHDTGTGNPDGIARCVACRARQSATAIAATFRACRCSVVWWASQATTWCVASNGCQTGRGCIEPTPEAHYLAPRSLLVFDHLTRGVALLHAGSEAERVALRKEVIQALRGPIPTIGQAHQLFAGHRQPERSRVSARCCAHQGVHRGGRCLSAGVVGALLRSVQPRAV